MSQKYKICLEITDLDTFIVVMKVVEKNKGIKVTEAGIPMLANLSKPSRAKHISHHRSVQGSARELFMKYLKTNKMSEFHYRHAKEWFVKNKYAANTASSTINTLMTEKKLKRHGTIRSMYIII